ncbi:flippase-like domain-containing protein [Halopenitus sp. H-Gu1]|uniref:flippase-like domain-containing protein n=1 Tax=Halopenitus sp. H-Gu1 TaxID=3242697 RepID=UPI00359E7098
MNGSTGDPTVSVVLPAYNEEATLEDTVETTLSTLAGFLSEDDFEVIVAEDGCADRTPEIADRLAAADDRVRHVHSDDRLGRGGALERAFEAANGDVLVYFDTDLATDMSHLEELVESVRSGEYDLATGSRWMPGREAERPAKRGIPSRGFNLLVRTLLGSEVRDHQCGFKAISRDAFRDLIADVEDDHWFWDTELLVRAQREGYRIKEFPVSWEPKGDTKVDLVRDVLGMGSQIGRLWWQLSVRPRITPRVSFGAGLLLVAVAVALMSTYIDFGDVLREMRRANPRLLGVAVVLYTLSWPIRGYRYGDILRELGFVERSGFLTGAVFISQTGNLVLPARGGDAVRAYIVKMRRSIPYPSGFASLAAERVFDLLTLAGLSGVVLVGYTASGRLGEVIVAISGGHPAGRTAAFVAMGVGLAAIATVLGVVFSARSDTNRIRSIVSRISGDSYGEAVADVLERFVGDLQRVGGDPIAFSRVGATSIAIWVIDVLVAALVLLALDVVLDPVTLLAVCFFAVSVGNLAKVIPISPGGIGLYEGAFTALVVGLTPIGVSTALGAAVLDHALKNVVTLVGGVISMLALNVSLTTAVEETSDVNETDALSE